MQLVEGFVMGFSCGIWLAIAVYDRIVDHKRGVWPGGVIAIVVLVTAASVLVMNAVAGPN
jgi:hypothetical protein